MAIHRNTVATGPREHERGERVKELTVLHEAAALLQDDSRPDDAVLSQIAGLLPAALEHPADAAARVAWGANVHASPGWKATPWLLRSAFRTDDGREGAVEVAYVHAPAPGEEPFLAHERYLVDSVASMIETALDRRHTARDLGERVKELQALHATAALLHDDRLPDEDVLERITGLLPAAFQYPADTVARIIRGEEVHASSGWTETPWLLRSAFHTGDGREGAVDVCYLRERPPEAEGPFLAQERRLLDSVAGMLATSLDRRWTSQHLQHLEKAGLVRVFHWDVQRDRFIWPTLTPLETGGAPGPLSLTRGETSRLVHPEDQAAVTRRVDEALADPTRDSFTAEYRVAVVPDQYSWRQLLAHVIRDADGRAVRVIGTSIDNDEHKSIEARLRQTVKLEALGQLAGGVAHDLNNMLAVMLGRLQLALGRIAATEPAHRHLEEVLKAGNAATTLIRQILAFGRRQELRPRSLDLAGAIADMKGMLQSLLTRHIDLVFDFSPGAPAAMVDPNQFQQVVLNLCVNARDAMAKGGTVTLRVRRALERPPRRDLTRGESQEWAALEVEDTGTGIPPEVRDHIFEPFFTTKGEGQGTGLGLSTVHGIVVQSGGFLEVDT